MKTAAEILGKSVKAGGPGSGPRAGGGKDTESAVVNAVRRSESAKLDTEEAHKTNDKTDFGTAARSHEDARDAHANAMTAWKQEGNQRMADRHHDQAAYHRDAALHYRNAEKGKTTEKFFTSATAAEILGGTVQAKQSTIEETMKASKAKKCGHLNADGTFNASSAGGSAFDACVLHMQAECGGGHDEESAKKICGAIAAAKATEPVGVDAVKAGAPMGNKNAAGPHDGGGTASKKATDFDNSNNKTVLGKNGSMGGGIAFMSADQHAEGQRLHSEAEKEANESGNKEAADYHKGMADFHGKHAVKPEEIWAKDRSERAKNSSDYAFKDNSSFGHAHAATAHAMAADAQREAGHSGAAGVHASMADTHANAATRIADETKNPKDIEYAHQAHNQAWMAHNNLKESAKSDSEKQFHEAYVKHSEGEMDRLKPKATKASGVSTDAIKAEHGEVTGKPSLMSLIPRITEAIAEDPRFDTDSHGYLEGSPEDLMNEPYCLDILVPDDDGKLYAIVRTDDNRILKVGFEWDGEAVKIDEGEPAETECTAVYSRAVAEHEAAVKAGAPDGHPFYGNQHAESGVLKDEGRVSEHLDKRTEASELHAKSTFGTEHWKSTGASTDAHQASAQAYSTGEISDHRAAGEMHGQAADAHYKASMTAYDNKDEKAGQWHREQHNIHAEHESKHQEKALRDTVERFKAKNQSQPEFAQKHLDKIAEQNKNMPAAMRGVMGADATPTDATIRCRDCGVPFNTKPDGSTPVKASKIWTVDSPVVFQWMPGGISTITASYGHGEQEKPLQLTVLCDEDTAKAVQATLETCKAETPRRPPFGCVEHRAKERAFAPAKFEWSTDPEPAVYCTCLPSKLGADNVNGGVHTSFSPTFATDADYSRLALGPDGIWRFPEGVRGSQSNPARVTGCDKQSVGSLTNWNAFTAILPINARQPDGTDKNEASSMETSEHVVTAQDCLSRIFGVKAGLSAADILSGRVTAGAPMGNKNAAGPHDGGGGADGDETIGHAPKSSSGTPVDIGGGYQVHRHGMDANGNHSVWVSKDGGNVRKIQTSGNLPSVHGKDGEITKKGASEIKDYHKKFIAKASASDLAARILARSGQAGRP